jgi:hypothetical protein
MRTLTPCCLLMLAVLGGCAKDARTGPMLAPLPDESRLQTIGRSTYFVLEPGHQLSLANDGGSAVLTIAVTDDTRRVSGVQTRVVEQRDLVGGELRKVTRSFLAIDALSGDVWRFGEEVEQYQNNKIAGRQGSWLAGEAGATAGILVPGRPVVGQQLYQGYAPDVSSEWFEVISVQTTLNTPIGRFSDCLQLLVTDPLMPIWAKKSVLANVYRENRFYAAGIGLIGKQDLCLRHVGKAP